MTANKYMSSLPHLLRKKRSKQFPRKIRVINTLPRKNRNSTTEHALIDSTEIHKSINNNMSREGEMGQ
ncbi:unnamed protein product, partial [Brugia timori]